MANLPVTLMMLGGGTLLVWTGVAKPEGGLLGELRRVMAGKPTTLGNGPGAASGASLAASFLTGPAASSGAPGETAGYGATGDAAAVIASAKAKLGTPYQWGGNGPGTYDCSGFTVACYKTVGVKLPRTAAAQQVTGHAVSGVALAAPGDLIFYGFPAHHVAIYLGGQQIIHAPYTGTVVRVESVNGPGAVSSVRRVLSSASSGVAA